jgi:hypothetical protein
MAYIVGTTVIENVIDAHNATHAQTHGTASKHNDGPDYSIDGVEQVLTGGSPTTLNQSASVFINAKSLFNNNHLNRGGNDIFAHKVVDSANVVTANMSPGQVYTAAILYALQALVGEEITSYNNHISNKKPDGTASGVHVAPDTTNVLGGNLSLDSFTAIAYALNDLKLNANNHFVFSVTASPHLITDSVNIIAAPNATDSNYDSMINLANDIKAQLNGHYTQAGVHPVDDTFNTIVGANITNPAGIFDLAVQYKTKHNAHVGSTTYHNSADATNALVYSGPATISELITAAQEVYTKQTAHFRAAPVSRAMVSV